MKRAKRNYDTIGLARFDPNNRLHQRVLKRRNEYRAAMQQGISLRSFRELFFACSCCGSSLPLPHAVGYTFCSACGQYFYKGQYKIQEVPPPDDWQPEDPNQLSLLEPP